VRDLLAAVENLNEIKKLDDYPAKKFKT